MSGYDDEAYKRYVREERARRRNQPPPEPVIVQPEPVIEPVLEPAPEIITPIRLFKDAGGSGS